MDYEYHQPVLLVESIEGLEIKPDGIYVDLTFGGGGHSNEILKKLDKGRLFAFDQDQDAKAKAADIFERSFTFIPANFRFIRQYLKLYGIEQVDGIFGDFGISSHQIDEPERGFSIRGTGRLDMRMNKKAAIDAATIVNEHSEKALQEIFSMYGEIHNAKVLAREIVAARAKKRIETTGDLIEVLNRAAPRFKEYKYFAKVFQALRIVVNDELKAIEEMLGQSVDLLKQGGRLVLISYHSLEDRLVKNFMTKGNIKGETEKDFYGNLIRPFEPVNKKPITPGEEELMGNSRSRSAKLRIAVKL
jgi:16S rRNA (cytosine1402-N4)-methyltransferase